VEITEVRIKLMEDNSGSNERLQAFCSITFDDMFVIRDLKIIEGAKGFFVAMPSRKLTDRCHNCGTKNHLRSRFCNQCGCRLDENRALRDADGRAKLHADIAHPINSMCREKIQAAVLSSYADELERSKIPRERPPWPPATNRRCAGVPCAVTPSTLAVTSRYSAARTSPLAKRARPKESAPTIITIAVSRRASATAFDRCPHGSPCPSSSAHVDRAAPGVITSPSSLPESSIDQTTRPRAPACGAGSIFLSRFDRSSRHNEIGSTRLKPRILR
jgi:DNA-binding cell septation regulator SpoVG